MAYGMEEKKGSHRMGGGNGGYRLGNDGSTVSAPRGDQATVKDKVGGGNAGALAADDRKTVKH